MNGLHQVGRLTPLAHTLGWSVTIRNVYHYYCVLIVNLP